MTPFYAGDGRLIGWSFWERYGPTVYTRRILYPHELRLPTPRRPRRWWRNQ